MRLIRIYSVRIVFVLTLLLGLQLPAVVEQYGQRVDAQYRETQQGLDGFRQVANRYFDGDIEALIAYHERSSDPVFRAEAEPLRQLFSRAQQLASEQQALAASFPARLLHVAVAGDRTVLSLTLHAYQPVILLTADALVTALLLALSVSMVLSLLLRILVRARKALPTGRSRGVSPLVSLPIALLLFKLGAEIVEPVIY